MTTADVTTRRVRKALIDKDLVTWRDIKQQAETNVDADGWLEACEEIDRLLDSRPR